MKTLFIHLSLIIISFTSYAQTDGWIHYDGTNSSIPFDKVFYLEFDHDGNLWGGTSVTNQNAHLFMFDGINFINHNAGKWVYDIKVDAAGNIWTVNSLSELSKFDGTSWTDIKNSDLGWYSSPLYIDGNDNKWANPLFSGTLLKYDGTNWTTYNNSNTFIPDNKINCINGEGSNIYFGTNDSGLIHFNGTNWITLNTSNSQLPANKIYASCTDQNDSLWMICEGGYIVSMKDNNWSVYYNTLFNAPATSIDLDSKGNIWIAQSAKILKIEGSTITEFSSANTILPDHSILTLKIDKDDKVWIGSRFGLFVYQEEIDTSITINSHPQSVTINEGEFVKFEIGAEGENLTYQWQKGGTDIQYATSDNYQIASVGITDAGKYKCIVKNAWGQFESDEAELIVNTGSGINELLIGEINISPNPSRGHFYVTIPNTTTDNVFVQIFNVNGQQISENLYSINIQENKIEISLNNNLKATFIIRVFSYGELYRKLFSVQ